MSTQVSQEIIAGFIEEVAGHLPGIRCGITAIPDPGSGEHDIHEMRRLLHNIKGAASMIGYPQLSLMAFRGEEASDAILDGKLAATAEVVAAFECLAEGIETFITGIAAGRLNERAVAYPPVAAFAPILGRPLPEAPPPAVVIERLPAGLLGAADEAEQAAEPEGIAEPDALAEFPLVGEREPAGGDPVTASPSRPALDVPSLSFDPQDDARPRPARFSGIAPDLLDTFLLEAEELLQQAGDSLRLASEGEHPAHHFLEIRRAVHTLKGAAGSLGLHDIGRLSHRLEDLLDAVNGGQMADTAETLATVLSGFDCLTDMTLAENPPEDLEERIQAVYAGCDGLLAAPQRANGEPQAFAITGAETAAPGTMAARTPERRITGKYVRVPLDRLDEIVRLVSELVVNRSTFEQHVNYYARNVDELQLSVKRLRRITARVDHDVEVNSLGGFGQLAIRAVPMPDLDSKAGFDALEFDRYSEFHMLARDLTETSNDLGSAGGEFTDRIGQFDGCVNRLGRLTSELQDKLMRLRMVPLMSIESRLRRTVRVTGERSGKSAQLAIRGGQADIDKSMLEELAGPLEHILRNAVDHGIEPPSERAALGKPEAGRITLDAHHEGTQVVIAIEDDGAGLRPERIRAAAVESGIYSAEDAALLSDADLFQLIFMPGFSTARRVSETSGRGVGMDVVKSVVSRLKGTLAIDSRPGAGTRILIRLPLTLAIMRVLLVRANGETFAMPLDVVTKIERLDPERIEYIGQSPVARIDGKVLPAMQLGDVLNLQDKPDPGVARRPGLVLNSVGQQFVVLVDEVYEAREVVVKSTGAMLANVRGIRGATLMGDGSVVLILNPADLAPATTERPAARRAPAPATAAAPSGSVFEVLIVDDSISIRKVLSNLIRSSGWNASAAKDGLEALEMLQHSNRRPDVILLDIEMPRMDGYELTSSLRGNPQFRNIPIVMLTSRAGEKHRSRAFELGVTDYMVKPYQEEKLLETIRRVVGEAREALAR